MPNSGSGFEGDSVTECLELSDVVAPLGISVDGAREVVGAEVVVAGIGIGKQVPENDQHRAADRDDRLLLLPTSRDAAVALTEEGVGAPALREDGGLPEGGAQRTSRAASGMMGR